MKLKKFSIGMRTIKTGISIFLCILLFHIFDRGSPMIAALAAAFAMRQDIGDTVKFGRNRVIGNTIGGVAAVAYYALYDHLNQAFLIQLLVLPLVVMLTIALLVSFNLSSGIIGATSTLLMIALSIPHGETVFYAVERVVDTFIGTVIAIGVNALIKPPKAEEIREINTDLATLEEEESELKDLKKEIQNKQS